MSEIKSIERDPLYVVSPSIISQKSKRSGVILVRSTFILMITIALIQGLYSFEKIDFGFSYISVGDPICKISPSFIIQIFEAIVIAST